MYKNELAKSVQNGRYSRWPLFKMVAIIRIEIEIDNKLSFSSCNEIKSSKLMYFLIILHTCYKLKIFKNNSDLFRCYVCYFNKGIPF